MADEDKITLTINGKHYEIEPDDLELDEVEILEDICDAALEDIDFRRASAIKGLVFIVQRRKNPSVTLESAGKIKLKDLGEQAEENGASARPTRAKAKAKADS